jgi:polyferredoxin
VPGARCPLDRLHAGRLLHPDPELVNEALTFSFGPWELFWIFFYGGFTYLFAGVMREQVCKYMCPYARFQGVMFDPDTLVITYDPSAAKPGARAKGADPNLKGDCVDCGICVQVPDRHRHPQRHAVRVHRLRGLYRRLRSGHGRWITRRG